MPEGADRAQVELQVLPLEEEVALRLSAGTLQATRRVLPGVARSAPLAELRSPMRRGEPAATMEKEAMDRRRVESEQEEMEVATASTELTERVES